VGYQEYPKTLPRDDFWGRCVAPLWGDASAKRKWLLVDHIREQLRLRPGDILLDIGCGNGALAPKLFDDCAGYAGVDLSPYLIEVAQEFFADPPNYLFFNSDAAEFVEFVDEPDRFTRGLCLLPFNIYPRKR